MTPFLGQIMAISFNFAPKGWAFCQGQLLPINQNQALFSLLGTTYGGNGVTTFALPNLQTRVPVGWGSGNNLGQTGGEASVTLNASQVPQHTHQMMATGNSATANDPKGNVLATAGIYQAASAQLGAMSTGAISSVGGQPHDNQQPYLVINYVIALQGIFPSRN